MFLKPSQLLDMGFKAIDLTAKISDKASIYGAERITIGAYTRIDDFAIISAGVEGIDIGAHVHIACQTSVIGGGKITLSDYSAISSKTSIFSSSDPYDGSCMTNPCVDVPFRITYNQPVFLGKHTVVGAGCTILPGVRLESNCAVGSMSLVNKSFGPNAMIYGIPATYKRERNVVIYEIEKDFEEYKRKRDVKIW